MIKEKMIEGDHIGIKKNLQKVTYTAAFNYFPPEMTRNVSHTIN